MTIRRRLEVLEARATPPRSSGRARELMKRHFDRVAALRRGELGPDEAAEVCAVSAAMERRLAERRSRGGGC